MLKKLIDSDAFWIIIVLIILGTSFYIYNNPGVPSNDTFTIKTVGLFTQPDDEEVSNNDEDIIQTLTTEDEVKETSPDFDSNSILIIRDAKFDISKKELSLKVENNINQKLQITKVLFNEKLYVNFEEIETNSKSILVDNSLRKGDLIDIIVSVDEEDLGKEIWIVTEGEFPDNIGIVTVDNINKHR